MSTPRDGSPAPGEHTIMRMPLPPKDFSPENWRPTHQEFAPSTADARDADAHGRPVRVSVWHAALTTISQARAFRDREAFVLSSFVTAVLAAGARAVDYDTLGRNPFDSVTGPLDGKTIAVADIKEPTHTPSNGDPYEDTECSGIRSSLITATEDPAWSFAALSSNYGEKLHKIGDKVGAFTVTHIGYYESNTSPSTQALARPTRRLMNMSSSIAYTNSVVDRAGPPCVITRTTSKA